MQKYKYNAEIVNIPNKTIFLTIIIKIFINLQTQRFRNVNNSFQQLSTELLKYISLQTGNIS